MHQGLLSFAVRTEHVDDFVLVEFLHLVASRTEVFTGVELSGFLSEDFTHSSSHCKTAVGVNIDLANVHSCSLAELLLRDADCIGQFATVLVYDLHVFLRNGRRAVEHDGEVGEFLLYSLKHVECQWRGNEKTCLLIAGALCRSELVSTVRSADRDSEAIATCAGNEVDYLSRVSVGVVVGANLVLNACEYAELTLYSHVELMSVVNHFLSEGNVLLIGEVATVDHYGRETVVDAVLASLESVTVVEVKHDLGMLPAERLGIFNGTL